MVGIVSLNSCVDKTFYAPAFCKNSVTRVEKTFAQAGGKGINTARVLKSLGAETRIFTMLAGEQGRYIKTLLDDEGLQNDAVFVNGQSRMYLTFMDENADWFAVKENGPCPTDSEAEGIKQGLIGFLDTEKPEFLCISDTCVCDSLLSFYPFAVTEAKKRGIPVFFDCDGEAMRLGWEAAPDYVKPNEEEYAELFGAIEGNSGITETLLRLRSFGIAQPLISRGENGVSFLCGETEIHAVSRNTRTVSAVGCGDSFIGGTVYGLARGLTFEDCVRWGSAAAAVNAEKTTAARVTYDEVCAKLADVELVHKKVSV